ncbi:MAG: hypothetical protein II882_09550 [Lachnospiraceae bacterium]|nr:hypothetical protein [Lachnospiraceae bacterium]
MTEMEFARELDGSYLLVKTDQAGDSFSEKMIAAAAPPHLLPLKVLPRDGGCEYRYEISGTQSLSNRLATREIEAPEIRELIRSIYRVSLELEDHLLDTGSLWLEPGVMFRGKTGWLFCYLPVRKEPLYAQMQPLSRYILKKCSHDDTASAELAYRLFSLCHEENTSFPQLLEAMETGVPAGAEEEENVRSPGLFGRLRKKRSSETTHRRET